MFDTGSDWLVVESAICENPEKIVTENNCLSAYNPNFSANFVDLGEETETKVYGSFMRVEGRQVQDQVCLKKRDVCIDPFNFFLVTEQSGIPSEVDGIVGLALGGTPRGFNMPSYYKLGYLYLDFLRVLGHVEQKTFSTSFAGAQGESFIDFGPEDKKAMSDISEQVAIPVK